MIVKGTKKLLTYLKVEPEETSQRITREDVSEEMHDPLLFSWYANMITIERKNILIFLNEKTRFAIILQGVKASDRKNIRVLIKDAVKDALEKEFINPQTIEAYLNAMGEVEFQKATDRSILGRVKSIADDIYGFGYDHMDFNRMSQGDLGRRLNSSLYRNKNKELYVPMELMVEELKGFSLEEDLIQVDAVELKITLNLQNEEVWRKVIIPLKMPFEKFHKVIQFLFFWKDDHMHEFHIQREEQKPIILVPEEEMMDFPDTIERRFEKGVELAEYLPQYQKLKYIYDFGDYWEHDIELVQYLPKHNSKTPYCTDGVGQTPPEDVGGPGGYEEFLEIINDPLLPMREEMLDWAKMQNYTAFNLKRVNGFLRLIRW